MPVRFSGESRSADTNAWWQVDHQAQMGEDKGAAGEHSKEEHHPVPPAQHSNPNLPRALRARVGATSDPVPAGKHIDAEPKKHFTLVGSAHGGGAAANAHLNPSEAKEVKEAHKEELKHTHDKGMENLSNAAVKGAGSAPARHQLMDDRRAHYGQLQSTRGQS
ncbi:hypothetical protein WJX81_005790 [Elliptochloris bilobata]|uniref:Uncharacterized protein n=1 Tax=Elliptochloris bilobata TaxID=381761 RepID=A0AAW1S116_9CHLO